MAKRRLVMEVGDGEDLRRPLGAMTVLMVLGDTIECRRVNELLKPVRAEAKAALLATPRSVRSSHELRRTLARCDVLVDRAAREYEAQFGDDALRRWVARTVPALVRAVERRSGG